MQAKQRTGDPSRRVGQDRITIAVPFSSRIAPDPRQDYARYVRFRPGDGQEVALNPPRFSWPCVPEIAFPAKRMGANMRFTLQVSQDEAFTRPVIEIADTPYNFYNFLPSLKGAREWFWRAGYRAGGQPVQWSETRSFTLADGADEWDRSRIPAALDALRGHPRLLFNRSNRDAVLGLREKNACSDLRPAGSSARRAMRRPMSSQPSGG